MLEKDFVFILMGNPQGYPQKLWIDVTRPKPHCHFLSWTLNESVTCLLSIYSKTFLAHLLISVELEGVTCYRHTFPSLAELAKIKADAPGETRRSKRTSINHPLVTVQDNGVCSQAPVPKKTGAMSGVISRPLLPDAPRGPAAQAFHRHQTQGTWPATRCESNPACF